MRPLTSLALFLLLVADAGRAVPRARGAGAAERAERTDHHVGGTIREALLGGIIEPQPAREADDAPPTPRYGSRCASTQSCVRMEECATTDVLFECAAGRVCCFDVPTPAPSSSPLPVIYPSPPPPGAFPTLPPDPRPTLGQRDKVSSKAPTSPLSSTSRPFTKATTDTRSLLPRPEVCGQAQTENRITNGKIALPGQFPWMALLGYSRRGSPNVTFLCGGTLINWRYVLTAAHCFSAQSRPMLVRLGEFNLTSPIDCDHNKVCAPAPEDIAVESVIPHPEFNIRNIKHDIALIRLRRNISEYSDYIRPICLPLDVNITDDRKFKIAGWGKTDFKDTTGSAALQFTDVRGVGHDECNALQPPELKPLAPGQICAGGDKGKDACKGDSGGPLMITLVTTLNGDSQTYVTYQVGVVSYGPDTPCGTAPLPSIYTRVSTYIPWILNTIKP